MKERNLQRKVNELKSLLDISFAMISMTKLKVLLRFILKEITKIVNAQRSTIFFIDRNTNELRSYIAEKLKLKEIRIPLKTGIAGWVARTGKTISIRDVYKDKRFDDAIDKKLGFRTKSVLCAPIKTNKGLIGIIEVLNKKKGYFDSEDISLVRALSSHIGIAIENTRLHEEKEILFTSLIRALSAAIDARDEVTSGHSERVAYYSVRIGKALGLGGRELKVLEFASLLHDIGKIGVRDAVLAKKKKLSKKEFEIIKGHVQFTKEILGKIQFPEEIREVPIIASFHHEMLDGSGYPSGLKGMQIPKLARIIAVADKFDAMVSYDRPYKRRMAVQQAIKKIKEAVPLQLDPKIVDAFVKNRLYLMERRKYIRIGKKLGLRYEILPEGYYKKYRRSKNISPGGLLFPSSLFIPPGSYLSVRIDTPGKRIHAIARVARADSARDFKGYNIGIRFINLTPAQKMLLSRYLS